jgi:hypothetical protein
MIHSNTIAGLSIARLAMTGAALAALAMTALAARAHDESKYPNWAGQWSRVPDGDVPRYDPGKPLREQPALLTPEYRVRYEASVNDQRAGGFGLDLNYACIAQTMPRLMNGAVPFEFAVSPTTTHILYERMNYQTRRIYTDGRPWPQNTEEQTSGGYSIGKWVDTDGDGRFDLLEVETRNIRGPRTWDQTGMPMADDPNTIVQERITLDKANPNILRNEMTTTDASLTRPWTATTTYRRTTNNVLWREDSCLANPYITIEKQVFMLGGDGKLMPMKKDQAAPDLTYFKPAR